MSKANLEDLMTIPVKCDDAKHTDFLVIGPFCLKNKADQRFYSYF